MTPITKNINIYDTHGRLIGHTYPKRAKGLIKKGRAQSMGPNEICMAVAALPIMEDNMENVNNTTNTKEEQLRWIRAKIDEVTAGMLNISKAIVDIDSDHAEHLSDFLVGHQDTYQQTLRMLNKMLDSCLGNNANFIMPSHEQIETALMHIEDDESKVEALRILLGR